MKSFRYTITDGAGIHARPAGMLVKEAKKYRSNIVLFADEKQADIKKLMALMALGITKGQGVEIRAEGEDEEEAIRAMEYFFENNL